MQHLHARGDDINARDKDESTALHSAAARGHLSVVEYLHENGSDINAQDKEGSTALHKACQYGHLSVAEYMLANGADLNALERTGGSALHAVVSPRVYYVSHYPIVSLLQMLLEADADIHERPGGHKTLCTLAVTCYGGSKEVLQFLLKRGADVNAKNTEGLCALVEASRLGRLHCVKILINAGAGYDVNHGVDHDVWNQAIAEAHNIDDSESKSAMPAIKKRSSRNFPLARVSTSLMLQVLRSGLQQAEERWADQQRENFLKSCAGQS